MECKTYKQYGSKFLLGMMIVIIALMVFGLVVLSKEEPTMWQEVKTFMYGVFAFFTMMLFYAINGVAKKISIDNDTITYTSLFKNKEIALNNIKKFRVNAVNIELFAHKGKGFKVFKNLYLADWLEDNFANFNTITYEKEVEEIMQDSRFGVSEEERAIKLDEAGNFSNIITAIGYVHIALAGLFSVPVTISIYIGLFLTLAIIFGIIYYNGRLRLEGNTAFPSLYMASFTAIISSFVAYIHIGHLSGIPYVKPSLIIALLLTIFYILVIVGTKKFKFINSWFPLMLFFGLTITGAFALNIVADTSEPKIFTTQIQELNVLPGRYTSYEIKLASLGGEIDVKNNSDIDVSYKTFKEVKVGDTVQVKLYDGFLENKWFVVYKDDTLLNGCISVNSPKLD